MNHPMRFWQKKSFIILTFFITAILVVRAIAPGIILKKMNAYLGNFSPLYAIHIDDLDLHFFRMAYSFDRVTGTLKKNSFQFMSLEKVDVSLAWRELIRGHFVADVDLKKAKVDLTLDALHAVQGYGLAATETDAKNVKDATIPFNLERLRLLNSELQFSDLAGLPPSEGLRITGLEGVINNLTPAKPESMSLFSLVGSLQETAAIKLVGQAKIKKDPADWSVNVEIKNFDLKKINPLARRMIPLTFKSGSLTLFVATQSVDSNLRGYLKPFIKDLVFVGDHGDFKNVGQFFIEILGTIGNFFLKNSKTQALATRINFKKVNGKMDFDTGKALDYALKNGFGNALPQSFDETLELK